MTYKEFIKWCNERASDGCWGILTVIQCIEINNKLNSVSFWKRKKLWETELNKDGYVEKHIVDPINKKIQELQKCQQ